MNCVVTSIERLMLFSIIAILGAAAYAQFAMGELPCPLCLLQRLGFFAIAFGLLANRQYGPRTLHYGLSFLGVLFTQLAAGTQVLRHIAPGDPGYSLPFWGLHLYTWAFVAASCYSVGLTVLLLLRPQASYVVRNYTGTQVARCDKILYWVLLLLALLNTGSALVECRLGLCPADPIRYELLS